MRSVGLTMMALGVLPAAATAQQPPAPAAPSATPAPQPVPPAAAVPAPEQQAAPPARTPRPAVGQAPDNADISDEPDVIVTGQRNLPGSVIGDIPSEEQLGPADIRSYGVSSVADLLNELSPQTRSGRGSGGAPVVLLNGRRISSFAEIRDLPTEAIARVDILPEEVALKYGYTADQRVVNFVLRRRFRAITAEVADRISSRFDRNGPQGELDLLNIRQDRRFNLHSSYQENNPLFEDQRTVLGSASPFAVGGNVVGVNGGALDPSLGGLTEAGVPAAGGGTLADFAAAPLNSTDLGPYRTLLGRSRTLSVNSTYSRNIFGHVGATVNARLEGDDGRSDQGLPTVSLLVPAGNPFSPFSQAVLVDRAVTGFGNIQQRTSSLAGHLGATLNGDLHKWRWNVIANYDNTTSTTLTDTGVDAGGFQARLNANDPTANPFAALPAGALTALPQSFARSHATDANIDAQANGTLFRLPAGDVSTSIAVGGDTSDFASRSIRGALVRTGQVSRDSGTGRLNIDLPITSRSKGVLGAIGNLSLNGNAKVEQLSDFGTLTTLGYGANWQPVEPLRIIVSVTDQDGAPTAQQLGNPQVVTPNVRVFDYVQGTTATVTTVSGGNPALQGFSTHTAKVGLTLKPWKSHDLTIIANYVTSHVDDPVASFPAATAAIAAAFPGRFTRDPATGTLLRVDTTPINFARTSRSELRYGFNLSLPLKSDLQRKFEAFRNGTGPNPFAGLNFPGFGRRPGQGDGASGRGQGGTPEQGSAPAQGQGAGADQGQPGTSPPAGDAAAPPTGALPAPGQGGGFGGGRGGFGGPGGGGGGGGRGGFGGRGQGGGRLQFALYHTWHFTDDVLVAPGGPRLDLLNGDAIGSTGGQSRHELEGQAGYSNNGLGARLSENFQSATRVNGGTAGAPEQLRFGALATTSLRLFFDPTARVDLLRKHPWVRGTRLTFSIDNLFDARQHVTDQTGATPVSYQPDLLDPLGRTIRLSIRKLFF
ncbi:TonB-dependent receptor [uncultured Sphingomonas sp.]|uniref:TonB-dependent receptor n=1 Tax=uncultured Sphingomonas sp. TaxID=158754 RepID=UPI0035C9E0A4